MQSPYIDAQCWACHGETNARLELYNKDTEQSWYICADLDNCSERLFIQAYKKAVRNP